MLPTMLLWRHAARHSGRVYGSLATLRGKTLSLSGRFADGKLDRLSGLIAELVSLQVEVIVTAGGTVMLAGT